MVTIEEALIEAKASALNNILIVPTIIVKDSSGELDPIYIVRDTKGHDFIIDDNTTQYFEPVAFDFSYPLGNSDGYKAMTFKVDNVDERLRNYIVKAKKTEFEITLTYRDYIVEEPQVLQERLPYIMILSDLNINTFEVTGQAISRDFNNKFCFDKLYTTSKYKPLAN